MKEIEKRIEKSPEWVKCVLAYYILQDLCHIYVTFGSLYFYCKAKHSKCACISISGKPLKKAQKNMMSLQNSYKIDAGLRVWKGNHVLDFFVI